MRRQRRSFLAAMCMAMTVGAITAPAQGQMPKTTKESVAGAPTVKSETASGMVVAVEGNQLAVKMADGSLRIFNPPSSVRFMIDGRDTPVSELKPGTRLKATVTTTSIPITDRTTTVGSGKVWFVSGNTVILTLPNNENHIYKVAESYKFMVDGKPASVHDLRKGMTVSAEKIVEEPRVEVASNTVVTGVAPPAPKPVVSEVATPKPVVTAPPRVARPVPAEAARAAEAPAAAPEAAPAKLPKTGSELPITGILGALSMGASLLLRGIRRL